MARLRTLTFTLGLALTTASGLSAQQPLPPEQQAEKAVAAGQKAYNEGNFGVARERFQDVVTKFANTPQANAARYGLALAYVNVPDPNYAKAAEELKSPTNDGNFKERPQALALSGAVRRQLGLKEPKPDLAQQQFQQAGQAYVTARDLLRERDPEASARYRCDHAEMLLRTGKTREARAECEPFLKDPLLAKNKSRPLGLYYHGLACFLDKDVTNAGRSLMLLSPFDEPSFGPHAEYLVGRVFHLTGETAEAGVHYDAVLANCEKLKKDAAEQLKKPEQFKTNPVEKARLEALTKSPPEYVAGATFHAATLCYEANRVPEALAKFQQFAKDYPASPLAPDAQLRIGFCQVQSRQFEEAVKTLTPLVDKPPRLADQVQFQLGKAQLGLAENASPAEREAKKKAATEAIRKATEKAAAVAGQDPYAKARRQEMLFDLAEALSGSRQYAEAAKIYEQLWNENASPARREEVLLRLATAFGNAGNLDGSQQRCDEFLRTFPRSPLLPGLLLRVAENSYGRAVAASKQPNRGGELQEKFTEASGKFALLAEKYPEFDRVAFARFGQGMCELQLGNLEAAAKAFDAVPTPDRVGELALTGYALADCLMRLAPAKAEDALQENRVREKLGQAAGLLEAFVGANPQAPEAPAALLKLGHCSKRLGASLADPAERSQALNRAREVYERLPKEYPKHALAGQSVVERAKVRTLLGDRGGATNDLKAFQSNPELQASPVAPLALVQLCVQLREQNQAGEAVKVAEEARKRYEAPLAADPERAAWVPLLKYQHGVSLLEAGKLPEARVILEEVFKASPDKPVGAEAALRSGQARIAEGKKAAEAGQQLLNQAGTDNTKRNAAQQAIDKGRDAVREAANSLYDRANQLHDKLPGHEARARMHYDTAWAMRYLSEADIARSRENARKELRQKQIEALLKKLPPNSPPPDLPLPEVDVGKLPIQDAQARAFDAYKRLVADFPETALAVEARLEWAEMLAERYDHEGAVKLLKDALEKEPADQPVAAELLERVRLRLGASLYELKQFAAAAAQFDAVAANPKSERLAQATYRAGEAHLAAGDPTKAVAKLAIFRDKGEFHNREAISDRAMLRLGQAHLAAKQYDPARQAFETLIQRFGPANPYAADARYGVAVGLQAQGKFDEAVAAYQAVIAATTGETAAKSQLQIGECRHAQKRYPEAAAAYQIVPLSYDAYPELGYAALLEAARAFTDGNEPAQAEAMLKKLLKDAPAGSEWAKAAAERAKKK